MNMYAYVGNDPVNAIDPSGKNAVTKFAKQMYKNKGDVIQSAADVAQDVATVFSDGASPIDRVEAAVSLVSPIDFSDAKAIKNFFRGSKPDSAPDFTTRPNDFKVDKSTGLVKPTHGVSVFDNATDVSKKGFTPNKIDQSTVPDSLQIIQRGQNKSHYEITPRPGANLTPQQYKDALCSIQCN